MRIYFPVVLGIYQAVPKVCQKFGDNELIFCYAWGVEKIQEAQPNNLEVPWKTSCQQRFVIKRIFLIEVSVVRQISSHFRN